MLIRVLVGIDDGQVHGVATGDDVYPLGNVRLWEAAAVSPQKVNIEYLEPKLPHWQFCDRVVSAQWL